MPSCLIRNVHYSLMTPMHPQALLEEDGVAEAFRSQTVSVSNPQHASRTFYMTASSNEERDAWVKAINTNIQAFSVSANNYSYIAILLINS